MNLPDTLNIKAISRIWNISLFFFSKRNIRRMSNRINDVGASLGRMKGDGGGDKAGSSPRTSAVLFHFKQPKCFTCFKSEKQKNKD